MKKIIFTIFLFCQITILFGQETVKIVTYGSGKTYESALSIALRSSLEQAAGVFISNMAVVKNDSLVYDEVKSISNGTITNYNVLAKVFDSLNAIHTLTIEAEIVPEKFVSFAKSINNSIEFNGNAFIRNIKLNRLYKENEPYILSQFLSQYFNFIDTNFTSLNSIYMDGWHKLYDKDVKIIGGDPFKYDYKPIDIWNLYISRYDSAKFTKLNWSERRISNFFIADYLIKNSFTQYWKERPITNVGNQEYGDITQITFKTPDFNFSGPELFDSVHILHNIISYYNDKFKIFFATQSDAYQLGVEKYEGKSYSEYTDYWYFRLHVWINKIIKKSVQLNAYLKKQDGKYVFNLQPILKPNDNYLLFISQLENIIKAFAVNQNDSFDQSAYEKNNDKLHSIYFVDINFPNKVKRYFVRNETTYFLFKSIINQLHIFAGGGQLFYEKLLKTDKGDIVTYLTGKSTKSPQQFSNEILDYNVIVINPNDQFTTVGVVRSDYALIGLRYLVVMSVFLTEEEMTHLNKFIIAIPKENESNEQLNDYTHIEDKENLFTSQQITVLDKIISDFEKATSNQIAIVTNESIGDFSNIKEYSLSIGNKLGIGAKDKNNGLLFVISKKRREIFIATGIGTEKIINNRVCQEIISETIVPYFKKNEFFLGVKAGIEESIKKWTVSKN